MEEALRAYTAGVAYAHFRDGEEGVIRPGMLADIVVLDRDIMADPSAGIDRARILATVVGGKVVYEVAPPAP